MKRVLITGGAGFVGCHLAKYLLANGYAVDIVDNYARGVVDDWLQEIQVQASCNIFEADLLDSESFLQLGENYSYIFHLAAIVGVKNVVNAPYSVLKNNISMHLNVIEFAKKQKKLERLIFASTSEVYAGTLQYYGLEFPTSETTPLAVGDLHSPRTSYMLSKIYGEALCIQSGLPYTIVRFHNIYGPRMGLSHVIPELLKKAYFLESGCELDVYSPSHTRSFCYIDDAVFMLCSIIETARCEDRIYNLGNAEQEISMSALAEIIINTVKNPLGIKLLENTPGSPVRRVPDMEKLITDIGPFALTSLKDGVDNTFKWYRKNVFDGNCHNSAI